MEQESERPSKRAQLWALTTLCWPLIVAMTLALLISREQPAPSTAAQAKLAADQGAAHKMSGKLLLVIVDGLRQQALDDHMPKTKQLGRDPDAWERPLHTCSGNFTVPCVQTILEGRQSPFAAGLENFTGKPGGAQSVPAIMARAGLKMAMISDFTLDTLYGSLALASINVEQWPGGYLDHDLETIKQAHRWLDEGSYDVLLVHVVGTDKVAHRQRPGHPKYAEHYAAVDEALAGLYKRLDYSEDHLIVVGDHGHDELGHHTRDSVVLVKGPRLGGLLGGQQQQGAQTVEQPELAYLLSLAAQVPLSAEYEGRLLGLEPATPHPSAPALDRALEQMERLEIQTLKAQGLEGETLLELRQAQLKQRAAKPWLALMRHSPLLMLYLGWVMLIAGVERGLKWRPRHITVGAGLCAVFLWFMGSWLPPLASGVMALLMLAALALACVRGPLKDARRMYSLWLAPLGLIVVISLLGARWSELLHSRGGLSWPMALFFLGLIGAGAVISRLHSGRWTESLPEAIGALCVLGLPSGVYYYQIGQNITRGFAIGGVLMLLALWSRQRPTLKGAERGQALALAVFGVGLGLTLWQSAGGWEWHAGIARALKRSPIAWPIVIYAGMGLAILGLLKRWGARAAVGALWVLTPLYAVGVGQLKWPMLVSASAAALTTAGWLALTGERWRAMARQDMGQDQREGLWLFGLWMMGCWALFSGFFIGQVDFNFAFEFLSMLTLERDVAIGASIMTLLKYSLPLWPMALLLGALRPARSHALTRWMMLALHIKIIALLIQLLCGPLFSTQKLYELALSELLFVFSLGVIILSGSALALLLRALLQPSRPSASA